MKNIVLFTAMTCAASAQIQIPDGIKIRVRLEQTLSSATAEEGQSVSLSVADQVRVGNAIVIPQGSSATGTVTQTEAKRRMGRSGKLDFSIDRVRAVDGQWIAVRYTVNKKAGGNRMLATGVTTGIMAAAFWPAAPFFLMMKGKEASIPKGSMFEVFTDDSHLVTNTAPTSTNMYANLVDRQMAMAAGFAPITSASANMNGQPAALPVASSGTAQVTITSSSPGSDIEVDGFFVGSTPSTVQLPAGAHRITVKQGSGAWERSVQISPGGAISLNAVFTTPSADSDMQPRVASARRP